jgi:hypothetical protein
MIEKGWLQKKADNTILGMTEKKTQNDELKMDDKSKCRFLFY